MSEPRPSTENRSLPPWRQQVTSVYQQHGWLCAALGAVLGVVSFPLDWLHGRITRSGQSKGLIDLYHCGSFCLSAVLLFLGRADSLLMLLWPILRICDTINAFGRVFALGIRPKSRPRAVLLLLLHYAEIVLLFACISLYLQAQARPLDLFLRNGTAAELTTNEILFYTFVTAATIGLGDITPNHDAKTPFRTLVYLTIYLKATVVLGILAIELSRVMNSREGE